MEYPMQRPPGPMATEREQLRWTQQENVRLNQGKDRLEEENRRLEAELRGTRDRNGKLYSAGLALEDKIRDLQGRLQREASAQTEANLRAETAEDEARAARAITAKRVELIKSQRDYWRGLWNAAKQNAEAPDAKLMSLSGELKAAHARTDRIRAICDQLVREKNMLASQVVGLDQARGLTADQQKTIKVLSDEKKRLVSKNLELWGKIDRQGNKLRQMRDSRNLWKTRAKEFDGDLKHALNMVAIYKSSISRSDLVPAEFVADAEKALMKKVEKAIQKAFEGTKK